MAEADRISHCLVFRCEKETFGTCPCRREKRGTQRAAATDRRSIAPIQMKSFKLSLLDHDPCCYFAVQGLQLERAEDFAQMLG
eukprot:273804-Amphidinium_carterae.3